MRSDNGPVPRIERISANDLTTLATDRGQVPMNIAAMLELSGVSDPAATAGEIAKRLASIRRFRQRLVRLPLGGGRPYWQDLPGFDPSVTQVVGDELDVLAELVCSRLPPDWPLWRLGWMAQSADRMAVILVVHHVLADGMGGLAVLAALADGVPLPEPPAPVPPPRLGELLRSDRFAVPDLREALAGLRELRSPGAGRLAPTSITQPTSSRRQVRVVDCDLTALRRSDATVNDVVLSAVSGALLQYLTERGERPPALVVSVPISRRATGTELGNEVGVVPVAVPAGLSSDERLRFIAERTAIAKQGIRGSSSLILSWMFRGLAAVHLGQFFVDHQRLVHTFETNLRGPEKRLSVARSRVERIVPVAVNPGNVGVSFDVLSYAGNLGITIVSDPAQVPDPDHLARLVARAMSQASH